MDSGRREIRLPDYLDYIVDKMSFSEALSQETGHTTDLISGVRPKTPTTNIIDFPHQSTPKLSSCMEPLTPSNLIVKWTWPNTSGGSKHKPNKSVQCKCQIWWTETINIIVDSGKRYVIIIIEAWWSCRKEHRVKINIERQNRQSDNQIRNKIPTLKDLRSDKKLKKETN